MRKNVLKYQMTKMTKADAIARCLASDPTASEWREDDSLKIFDRFARLDPTHTRQQKPFLYLEWMAREYLKTHNAGHPFPSFRFEELSEAVRIFDRYKADRPEEERDINRFNLNAVINMADCTRKALRWKIDDFIENASDEVMRQTTILYDGPEGVALVPHSRISGSYWGSNSLWCTTDEDFESENRFHDFHSEGPVVVLMPMEEAYYQAHKEALREHENNDVLKVSVELQRLVDCVNKVNPLLLKYELSEKHNPVDPDGVELTESQERDLSAVAEFPSSQNLIFRALSTITDAEQIADVMDKALLKDKEFMLQAIRRNPAIFEYCDISMADDTDILLAMVQHNITYEKVIPSFIWEQIPAADKEEVFFSTLEFDWKCVGYAHDFGVELSVDQQIGILEQALGADDGDIVTARLHLFPALREAVLFHQLDADEALDFLYRQSGQQVVNYAAPSGPNLY